MNRQKKKQRGITLIALVISIIVMLILAGVSLNLTIGDNGIIKQAQNATIQNSVALLEEYLQQEYIQLYNISGENYPNKIDYLISDIGKCQNYFQKSQNGKFYFVGPTNGCSYYFINKENLPTNIKNSLIGGNQILSSTIWADFSDIYGVTTDLKVYYCGGDNDTSRIGAADEEIVADVDETIAGLGSNSGWAKSLGLEDGISILDAMSQKSVTITDSNTDFSLAYNFVNMTKITLKGINVNNLKGLGNAPKLQAIYIENSTIGSLEGLENASKVTYFKSTNSKIENYYAMSNLINLEKLYIIQPVNKNQEIIDLCSDTKGIGKAKLTNLNYFGITGKDYCIESISNTYNEDYLSYEVTDISPLANLQEETKKSILHLYFQYLQLTDISSLLGFTNVIDLRVDKNNLQTLNGIQNMSNLTYLMANCCYNPLTSQYNSLGINESTSLNTSTDALSYIYTNNSNKNTSLTYISLRKNKSLKYVTYLSNCTSLTEVYLDECSSISDIGTLGTTIENCGDNYLIPEGMGKYILSSNMEKIDLKNETITYANLKAIIPKNDKDEYINNTALKYLRLHNTNITNNDGTDMNSSQLTSALNDILSYCPNMYSLSLRDQAKMTNINFVSSELNLKKLDLLGCTGITDLSLLETLTNDSTKSFKINCLAIDNPNLTLTNIQTVISGLNGASYWYNIPAANVAGLLLGNNDLIPKLNACTNVTQLVINYGWRSYDGPVISNDSDLSGMSNLSTIILYGFARENTITLPAKVKNVYWSYSSGKLNLGLCTQLEVLQCNDTEQYEKVKYTIESIPSAAMNSLTTINLKGKSTSGPMDYLSNLINFTGNFFYVEVNNWTPKLLTNIDGLGYLKKASSISIQLNTEEPNLVSFPDLTGVTASVCLIGLKFSNFDNISKCTSVSDLRISGSNLSNCDKFTNLTVLQSLNLNGNNITDINGLKNLGINTLDLSKNNISNIKVIDSLASLKYLNLKNNVIDDVFYYKDSDGTSKTKNTQEFLTSLYSANGFNQLYITGNNLSDYNVLKTKAWAGKDF